MSVTTEKTVRELALENPAATRVFEKLGIDYCCGGNKSLDEACRAANLNTNQVLDSLEMAEQSARAVQEEHNWQTEALADLIGHIKNTHHKYTREEIARLGPLFDKVCSVHGKNHPELLQIRGTFQGLTQELTTHLLIIWLLQQSTRCCAKTESAPLELAVCLSNQIIRTHLMKEEMVLFPYIDRKS